MKLKILENLDDFQAEFWSQGFPLSNFSLCIDDDYILRNMYYFTRPNSCVDISAKIYISIAYCNKF